MTDRKLPEGVKRWDCNYYEEEMQPFPDDGEYVRLSDLPAIEAAAVGRDREDAEFQDRLGHHLTAHGHHAEADHLTEAADTIESLERERDELRRSRDAQEQLALSAKAYSDKILRTAKPYLDVPCPSCGHGRRNHDPACCQCGCKGFVEPAGYSPDELAAQERARQAETKAERDAAVLEALKKRCEEDEASAARRFETRPKRYERDRARGEQRAYGHVAFVIKQALQHAQEQVDKGENE